MDKNSLTSQAYSINLNLDMPLHLDDIIFGDCRQALKKCDKGSVDLVVTSSPYADRRSKVYGGITPKKYVL